MIDVRIETPRSTRLTFARLLDGKAIAAAEAQALNRTAANVTTFSRKRVAEEMGLAASLLAKRGRRTDWRGSRKHGAVARGRKAYRNRLSAEVRGAGRPFNISRWKNTPIYAGDSSSLKSRRRRKGKGQRVLGVTHNAWGRTQTIGGVWQLKNGAYMVRDGSTFRSVYGPGVTHVLQYKHIERAVREYANERFLRHFESAISYMLTSNAHIR